MRLADQERLFILVLVLLFWQPLVVAAATEFQELGTTTRIDVFQNATARWTFETRINLTDVDQAEAFALFIDEQTQNMTSLIQDFSSRFSSIVSRASALTGRQMAAYAFNISFATAPTLTGGSLGLITYSFKWQGFAARVGNDLLVGDVFEGGFYLFDGDRLIVNIPANYTVSAVVPQPDQVFGKEVVWLGRRLFDSRNPYIELKSKLVKITVYTSEDKLEVGEAISVLGTVDPPNQLNLILTCTKPDGTKSDLVVSSSSDGTFTAAMRAEQEGSYTVTARWAGNEALSPAQSNIITVVASRTLIGLIITYWPVTVVAGAATVGTVLFLVTKRTRARRLELSVPPSVQERDEDLVLSILRSRGGTLPQSEIKELTGFSKAKTSFTLKSLQDKGYVWKQKWGREFLVRLKERSDHP